MLRRLLVLSLLVLMALAVIPAGGAGRFGRRWRPAVAGQPHRGHLPGEPQLRQPVRHVGGRQRPPRRPAVPDHPGQPGRHPVPVPAPERRQPDLAAPVGPLHRHHHRDRVLQPLPQPAVHHRRLHPAGGHHLPAARGVRPQRRPQRHRPARRLHPRPGPPLLPGAVPAQRRPPEPLCDRQRRRRADHGRLRHPGPAHLRVPAQARPPALRDRRQLLPVGLRGLVPEPPVADRGQQPGLAGRAQRRLGRRPALGGGRERDAEQLPAVRLAARRGGQGLRPDRLLQPGGRGGRRPRRGCCAATTRSTPSSRPTSRTRPGTAGHAPAPAPDRARPSATA